MLSTSDLNGEVMCVDNLAICVLHGENSKRGMDVYGTGSGTLTLILRALTFKEGEAIYGGGILIRLSAIVNIELCVFSNCRATWSNFGGGAIYVTSSGTTVNVYGTSFNGNTAASGNGGDIYRSTYGGTYGEGSPTITIHNTCPSPYSSNTPIEGEI